MGKQIAWIDESLCRGCGACIGTCPAGALTLVGNKVSLDREACTGCGACVDVCPAEAIELAIEGELVVVDEQPMPQVHRELSPPAVAARTAVVVTGVGLLARVGGALLRALGRWLARPVEPSWPTVAASPTASAPIQRSVSDGRGCRARHRRRGRSL
jgi:ferredoxin